MNESKKIKRVLEATGLLKTKVGNHILDEEISKETLNSLFTQLKQKIDEYSKVLNSNKLDKQQTLLFAGVLEDFSFSFKKAANK